MNQSQPITPESVRMTPHNVEAEEALLGSALIDPSVMGKLRKKLSAGDFFIERCSWLWSALCDLYDDEKQIDFLTVCDAMERSGKLSEFGGEATLSHMMNVTPTAIHAEGYARIIKECSLQREILGLCSDVAQGALNKKNPAGLLDEIINRAAYTKIKLGKDTGNGSHPRSLADIGPDLPPIEFLWPGWIPRGMISLLGAMPGAGKSFVALDLVRRIISNLPFPDESPQTTLGESCIYVDAELVPQIAYERATNWGMDMSKLFMMLPHPNDSLDFSRSEYQAELDNMAECLHPALIVIDSLSSISVKGENNIEDVRQILAFLNAIASRHQCGLLLIHHLRKRNPLAFMDLVTIDDFRGSSHIMAMSRSVMALSIIQTGPDPDRNGPRRLEVVKTNLNRYPDAIGVIFRPLFPKGVTLQYDDPPSKFREPTTIDKCSEWLLNVLHDGPLSPDELTEEGKMEGYSRITIYRARENCGSKIANTDGRKSPQNKWQLA